MEVVMLLDHDRRTVAVARDAGDLDGSRCPDCGDGLIAKRGELVVWHWAHRPGHADRDCAHEESQWHLRMKAAYLNFPGWQVEVPLVVGDGKFRVDAMNASTGAVREFVHSLSPYYRRKHVALKQGGKDVLWIMDGREFVSLRAKDVRRGGKRRFLKPRAEELHDLVGTLVHYEGMLWHEWRDGVWYPNAGRAAMEVVRLYEREGGR
jgi:competence CoiA-like predicted nuclease